MNLPHWSLPAVRRLLATLAATLVLTSGAWAAGEAKKNFDVPAGDAIATLRQAAQQGGVEIMFPADTVQGVKTVAVKGELTTRTALDKMLDGTGLVAVQDAETGAFAVKKGPHPNGPRVAQTAATPENRSRIEEGRLVLDKVEVTGSRIRSLTEEHGLQPMLRFDRQEIERLGVNSLGELFRFIPQATGVNDGLPTGGGSGGIPGIGSTTARVSVSLRGASDTGTLLLINGRRVPKTGQEFGNESFDFSGVPLGAIERVEVLLDGASAIYGSDAIGGVVNVILKKSYRGGEARLAYDNTFDKDASVKSASLTWGFGRGRISGLFSYSYEENNTLAARDRAIIASQDRRPYGGTDSRSTLAPDGRGRVRSNTAAPLPGLSTTVAGIPAGADGRNVTVAQYASAPLPNDRTDLAQFYEHTTNYRRQGATANLDFQWKPWLTLFAEGRFSRNENWARIGPLFVNNLLVPAGYPGNPFGVPVRLDKYFWDIPVIDDVLNDTATWTAGASGYLPRDWRYEISGSLATSRPTERQSMAQTFNTTLLTNALSGANPPLLLYDSTLGEGTGPNAAVVFADYDNTPGFQAEQAETWTYAVRADGPFRRLPAGDARLAAGMEYREEYADFPSRSLTSTFAQPRNRHTSGYYAEIVVPVFSEKNALRFTRQLTLTAAVRHDRYSDFGRTTNPRFGALWRPVSWIMLRASHGEGFKVPTLAQVYSPVRVQPLFTTTAANNWFDPARGNESQTGRLITRTSGGKLDLAPERSENFTAGLAVEVPRLRGLSLSVDRWENDYLDRVGSLTFDQFITLAPERVVRGANLPGDPAGWAGVVTEIDLRPINIAEVRFAGWDFGARYSASLGWGEVNASIMATRTTTNFNRPVPNQPPALSSHPDSVPTRITGTLAWTRGAWGTGVTYLYSQRSRTRSAAGVPALWSPSQERWDWHGSYDFAQSAWLKRRADTWMGRALADTRVRVQIFNVLNTEPRINPNNGFATFGVIDARMRRYALSATRKF